MNGAATQIASREFDGDFLQMPLAMQFQAGLGRQQGLSRAPAQSFTHVVC